MLNVLRFTPMKTNKFTAKYSCGAMYATILNNPFDKRFLREETILVCVIPGPKEPSLEQLNSVIEPFVEEMLQLNNGVSIAMSNHPTGADSLSVGVRLRVHGRAEKQLTHARVLLNSSDLPASRKLTGLRSYMDPDFMCPWCHQTVSSLTHPDCFHPSSK